MYAVTIERPGGPQVLRWTEVPDPQLRPGHVLIDVRAAGVNRADVVQRMGHYPPPPGAPPYPGLEVSGEVIEVSPGAPEWLRPTERVCALLDGGGYAERVVVPFGQVFPVPRPVDVYDAAGLPEAACTVWSNLIDLGRLREGETVLIHGGGSGIGTFAIQLARVVGARVITTARAEKHDALKALGAEVTIDYRSEDFVEVVKEATGGRGADVILDIVGGEYFDRNVAALARYGRLLIIGLLGGRRAQLDLGRLLTKGATIVSCTLRGRTPEDKARVVDGMVRDFWDHFESGAIMPVVDRYLPMPQAAEAHRIMESNAHLGKIILTRP